MQSAYFAAAHITWYDLRDAVECTCADITRVCHGQILNDASHTDCRRLAAFRAARPDELSAFLNFND